MRNLASLLVRISRALALTIACCFSAGCSAQEGGPKAAPTTPAATDIGKVEYPSYGVIVRTIDVPKAQFDGSLAYLDNKYVLELFDRLENEPGAVKDTLDGFDKVTDLNPYGQDPGWQYAGLVQLHYAQGDFRAWSGAFQQDRIFIVYEEAGTAHITEPVLALDISEKVDIDDKTDVVHVTIATKLVGMGPVADLPPVETPP